MINTFGILFMIVSSSIDQIDHFGCLNDMTCLRECFKNSSNAVCSNHSYVTCCKFTHIITEYGKSCLGTFKWI